MGKIFYYLRSFFRLSPLLCLLIVVALWVAGRSSPFRGVLWYGRNLGLFSAEPNNLCLILSHDSDAFPVVAGTPYLRLWTFTNNFHPDPGSGIGPGPFVSEPSDFFDNVIYHESAGGGFGPRPVYHHFLGAWIGVGPSDMLDREAVAGAPWWMLFTFLGTFVGVQTPLLLLRWRKGRGQTGLCPQCRYDLRASTGRCPECGRAFDAFIFRHQPPLYAPGRLVARADLHIRRHALGLLALTALASFFIAEMTRPLRPVVERLDWNQLPADLQAEARISEAFNRPIAVNYNIIDLCQRDGKGDYVIPEDLWRSANAWDSPNEGVGSRNGSLMATLTAEHHRQLINVLNKTRQEEP